MGTETLKEIRMQVQESLFSDHLEDGSVFMMMGRKNSQKPCTSLSPLPVHLTLALLPSIKYSKNVSSYTGTG